MTKENNTTDHNNKLHTIQPQYKITQYTTTAYYIYQSNYIHTYTIKYKDKSYYQGKYMDKNKLPVNYKND